MNGVSRGQDRIALAAKQPCGCPETTARGPWVSLRPLYDQRC
jgi:hypothetical protein